MGSLFYLVLTSVKNSIKELKQKPGKLILYILIIGLILFTIIVSLFTSGIETETLPASWLAGIYFAFLLMFFIISIQKGLLSGDTIFEMNDVNLLFVSPVNSRQILFYGLIRLAKMSFFAGFFILFQGATLQNFGIDFKGLLILFFVFICTMIIFSILSLLIYSTTNGKTARKRIVKILAILIFLPLAAFLIYTFIRNGDIMSALDIVLNSVIFKATPLIGWATAGALSLAQGKMLAGLGWLALTFLAGVAMFVYIMLSRSDYYEDVLVATETAFEKKRATTDGNVQVSTVTNSNVKVRGTGLKGYGANVFLYKHLRESFRENKFGFFGLSTIIIFAIIVLASLIFKKEIEATLVMQILMWMQVFMIGMGRGLKEIYSHYIYMIPESSFKKIIWANLEIVFKTILESVLFFLIPGFITGENILITLFAMLTYTLFSLLLIGINFVSIRWTQANMSNGILIMIYIVVVMLVMLPGVICGMIVGFMIGGVVGTIVGLQIICGWELLASVICFLLSRSVLDNCDMPVINAFGK